MIKFCHFKQKSAIWDSAKWNRQYGIWQSGIRQSGTNSLQQVGSIVQFLLYLYVSSTQKYMLGLGCLSNISVISWQSVLLVEESRVPEENYRPVARN
jgi:hypothetical protein